MEDGSLEQRIANSLVNITKLEVVTRVGDFKVELKGKSDPEVNLEGTAMTGGLYTRIDLVDGDTFNDLTADMLDPQRAELRAFHEQAVTSALAMVDARLKLIAEVAKWIAGEAGSWLQEHAGKAPAKPAVPPSPPTPSPPTPAPPEPG